MALDKTIILPDGVESARKKFMEILRTTRFILFVAIGYDDKIKNLVTTANLMAGGEYHNTDRRVVWLKDKSLVGKVIGDLERAEGLPEFHDKNLAGIFVNLDDQICDWLSVSDLPATRGRIARGFIKGSIRED